MIMSYLWNLLSIMHYIHAFGISGVLNVAPENDGGVFFIQFYGRVDAVHLFANHQSSTAALTFER